MPGLVLSLPGGDVDERLLDGVLAVLFSIMVRVRSRCVALPLLKGVSSAAQPVGQCGWQVFFQLDWYENCRIQSAYRRQPVALIPDAAFYFIFPIR